jgi:diguanylate cyclase (GGDEF)-like protein
MRSIIKRVPDPLAVACVALGAALSLAYFVAPVDATGQHLLYQAIGLCAVAAILIGTVRRSAGPEWWAIATGIALWVAGDACWNLYPWLTGAEAPYPSVADVLYLLAYVPLLLGIAMLVRGGRPLATDLVDASIVGLAAGLVVWFVAIGPSAHAHHGSGLAAAVSVVYPTMDYLLLVGLVQLFFAGGVRAGALRWVTVAFATVLVTDLIYARMRVDLTFTAGSYVNAGYFAFYLLVGVAALSARRATVRAASPRRGRLTLPRIGLLAAALLSPQAAMMLYDPTHKDDLRVVALVGSAIALLVLLRLALLFVERDEIDVARRSAQHALKQMAYQDGLTQLPNRRMLFEALGEVTRASDGTCAALLFVDLDGFKQINDVHGHMVGDAVLTEVAQRLRSAVRTDDLVARHGGDEFIILLRGLPGAHGSRLSEQTADRVRRSLAEPMPTPTVAVRLSASIGIALHPADGATPDELIRRADARMYEAKRARRDAA